MRFIEREYAGAAASIDPFIYILEFVDYEKNRLPSISFMN